MFCLLFVVCEWLLTDGVDVVGLVFASGVFVVCSGASVWLGLIVLWQFYFVFKCAKFIGWVLWLHGLLLVFVIVVCFGLFVVIVAVGCLVVCYFFSVASELIALLVLFDVGLVIACL